MPSAYVAMTLNQTQRYRDVCGNLRMLGCDVVVEHVSRSLVVVNVAGVTCAGDRFDTDAENLILAAELALHRLLNPRVDA